MRQKSSDQKIFRNIGILTVLIFYINEIDHVMRVWLDPIILLSIGIKEFGWSYFWIHSICRDEPKSSKIIIFPFFEPHSGSRFWGELTKSTCISAKLSCMSRKIFDPKFSEFLFLSIFRMKLNSVFLSLFFVSWWWVDIFMRVGVHTWYSIWLLTIFDSAEIEKWK